MDATFWRPVALGLGVGLAVACDVEVAASASSEPRPAARRNTCVQRDFRPIVSMACSGSLCFLCDGGGCWSLDIRDCAKAP